MAIGTCIHHIHIYCTHILTGNYSQKLQSILNSIPFNPTSGCRNVQHCNGMGGFLAFMEVPNTVCIQPTSLVDSMSGVVANLIDAGAAVGIAVAGLCAALLGAVLIRKTWRRCVCVCAIAV